MMLHSIKDTILQRITELRMSCHPLIVGIDGRCASGKTTLSAALAEALQCPQIHMDHFFLPTCKRTPERLSQPGGNVDKERFIEEVLLPLQAGESFSYRPFNCHIGNFSDPIDIPCSDILLIEGSYSLSPELWDAYHLRIFLTVDTKEQLRRIAQRNGQEALQTFMTKWIPLEEAYFSAFSITERCDLTFEII